MRCYKCSTLPNTHSFKECMKVDCQCICVYQLRKMTRNENLETISNVHPHFLDVRDAEVKHLPNLGYVWDLFNRINKYEWIENEPKIRYRGRCRTT